MTLQTRFVITIIFLFVFMYTGTVVISAYLNHEYMQQQLKSNADDTATSLGLILSQQAKQKNIAVMTSMIDAVFDRGYFQSIQLRDMKGKLLISRKLAIKIESVPGWFVHLMPFESPISKSLIMSGWRQVGIVSVQAHPGYAYEQLWATLLAFLFYCLMVAGIALLIGLLAIHTILRPVRAMGRQAQGIIDGHFPIIEKLPSAYRLRKTVIVMNRMSRKLKHQFDEHRNVASRLRKMVYHDALTGLNNRLYFVNHLKHEITLAKDAISATVMLIEVDGMKPYNQMHGYQAGDALLIKIAETMESVLRAYPAHFSARLYGVNFAVLFVNEDYQRIEAIATSLSENFSDLSAKITGEADSLNTHIGIVDVKQGMRATDILAAADMALSKARSKGDFNFDRETFSSNDILAESDWRQVITYIIEHQSFQLHFDPCYRMSDHQLLFHEVLMHAHDQQGHRRRASVLFSMAERFGMASQLDKMVIQSTIDYAKRAGFERDRYVLNLSMGSLADGGFIAWLKSTLLDIGKLADHLFFEVSEHAAAHHLDTLKSFVEFAKPLGTSLAIDHFGRTSSSFIYLRTLDIAYVKLDSTHIRNLHDNEDNLFYISSLVAVAHSLDIPVLADEVETEVEYKLLESVQLDAAQGRYFQSK